MYPETTIETAAVPFTPTRTEMSSRPRTVALIRRKYSDQWLSMSVLTYGSDIDAPAPR